MAMSESGDRFGVDLYLFRFANPRCSFEPIGPWLCACYHDDGRPRAGQTLPDTASLSHVVVLAALRHGVLHPPSGKRTTHCAMQGDTQDRTKGHARTPHRAPGTQYAHRAHERMHRGRRDTPPSLLDTPRPAPHTLDKPAHTTTKPLQLTPPCTSKRLFPLHSRGSQKRSSKKALTRPVSVPGQCGGRGGGGGGGVHKGK